LGYASLNLVDPSPVKLHFGKWNNRPVEPARVKILAAGFKQYGVRSWENPIPIVVPRKYVNVNALSQRMSEGECPPVIEWTPAAQGKFIE
ncbi:hypothetical protein BD414DRAFT_389617, partial [Trametes punicea]